MIWFILSYKALNSLRKSLLSINIDLYSIALPVQSHQLFFPLYIYSSQLPDKTVELVKW